MSLPLRRCTSWVRYWLMNRSMANGKLPMLLKSHLPWVIRIISRIVVSAVGSGLEVGKGFLFVHFTFKYEPYRLINFPAPLQEVGNGVAVNIANPNACIVAGLAPIRIHKPRRSRTFASTLNCSSDESPEACSSITNSSPLFCSIVFA